MGNEIFRVIEQNQARSEFTVMASMLELHRLDLVDLLVKGNPAYTSKQKLNTRTEAGIAMSINSSRSHLVLMINIVSVNRETGEQQRGKILIVDLAGSERLDKAQTEGEAKTESIEINKSLTALGDVIE